MKSGLRFSACDFSLQTSCWFQNCRLGRIASVARANALFEELPLHRVAGQRQRRTEVLARRVVSPAAQLKLAERRRVKRVWVINGRRDRCHTTALVRFAPESGQTRLVSPCRLRAISGQTHCSKRYRYSITSSARSSIARENSGPRVAEIPRIRFVSRRARKQD